MRRIIFVCHGNICRSPMAEAIAKKIVKERHLEKDFHITSLSTSTEATGEGVYPYADRVLREHGIENFVHISKQMTAEDYDKADEIYVMDNRNLVNIRKIIKNDPENKIKLLLKDREIQDPWYTRDFEKAYREILEGVRAII